MSNKNSITLCASVDTEVDVTITAEDLADFDSDELRKVGLMHISKNAASAPFDAVQAANAAMRGDNETLMAWAREQLYTVYGLPVFEFQGNNS